ncbi:MAG: TonB-dependent receptor [Gammaproteobacteria bacterium]|nr:TonB-dependent receptor [Gammaproteobacteria bacterium]
MIYRNRCARLAGAFATLATTLAMTLPAGTAMAQEDEELIEEIVTLGTRQAGRVSSDLAVPVDTLSSDDMAATGQTEVGRMLQVLAPSFNFSSSSISDGTDALRPATLRGLGPDQTLVLINGKRRHQAALIHINNSVGRGTAGTDLNAIPAVAIKRIEVLRDGAAAQYGSDAIAGVINIQLKDDPQDGLFGISGGEYSEGDGFTTNVDLYKGFEMGSDGYLGIAINYRDRERTVRANPQGGCLYGGCVDTDDNGFLEPAPGNEQREVSGPGRNGFRIGDADSTQKAIVVNAGFGLGEGEVYSFITYSGRENQSGAFYRNPAGSGAALDDGENVVVDGFLPNINSEIDDFSFNAGYRIDFDDDSSFDISVTSGRNAIDYVTSNSANYSFVNELNFGQELSDADIRARIPREAFAYGLELTLQTINLDYRRTLGDAFVAIGAELREDGYMITPGEEYAWRDYDTDEAGDPLYPQNASGGIQGFPGIAPANAVDETRNVISFYGDVEYQLTDNFLINGAVRFDDYDGFGDTTNFKLAGNFRVTDTFRLRGSASTGFRAPSMQQLYFNNISTQFIDGVQVETGTFRNDSALARAIGIPALKEEESTNISLGAVVDISDRWNLAIDLYSIKIDDRIVISNNLGFGLSPALDAALTATGASGGQFFLNAIDTETEGVDIVSTFADIQVLGGDMSVTFAANFTNTDITRIFSNTPSFTTIPPEDIFGGFQPSVIETWQPENRVSLSGNWNRNRWSAGLSLQRYGEYTTVDSGSQTYGAEVLTDLRVSYDFDNGLSFFLSGNNIFDVTPDEVTNSGSRGGNFESAPGLQDLASPTVFKYSRRSAPFGFNGAYWSLGANWRF